MTGDFATLVNPQSPDYAFSVGQLNGRELQRSPLLMFSLIRELPAMLWDSRPGNC